MIAEFLACDGFHLFDVLHYLSLNFGIDLLAVLIILCAGFRGNCEALRNGKTDICHFREVCTLAAEKLTHTCVTFRKKVDILLCHMFFPP